MNILVVAAVENEQNIIEQLAQQTLKPQEVFLHVDKNPALSMAGRRKRIAENHKILKAEVEKRQPDLVWQLEGDCDLPKNALEELYATYLMMRGDDFGYISGIQVGRHGIYCLGAWKNITEDSFESLDHKLQGIQEVDATGFYCLLAPTDVWLSGESTWDGEPYGPDVTWGLSIDKKKYVDMDLKIGHIIKGGVIHPDNPSTCNVWFKKINGEWTYKTS